MNEEELVYQILSGDRRALYRFYQTYEPQLARYLRMKIANPNDAEEILQDTLWAFLEAIRDYQGEASLKTFLFAICHHKIVDYYRKKKIRHLVFSRAPGLEKLVSPLFTPEERFDEALLKEKIQRVLGRILPRYRHVLLLKYLDDLSVSEIAQKLSISFKSAESQLFRARKAFVELFLAT